MYFAKDVKKLWRERSLRALRMLVDAFPAAKLNLVTPRFRKYN